MQKGAVEAHTEGNGLPRQGGANCGSQVMSYKMLKRLRAIKPQITGSMRGKMLKGGEGKDLVLGFRLP